MSTRVSLPIAIGIRVRAAFDVLPPDISLQEAICIANREAGRQWGCNECQHRTNECDLEFSSQDWPHCSKHPHLSNLKSFPFKRAPRKCFRLDFWHSAFAFTKVYEDCGNHDRATLEAWRKTDAFGRTPATTDALGRSGEARSGNGGAA